MNLCYILILRQNCKLLPDATVSDHGCVIRSPFLSVDARIDTQLKEIKDALQLIAKRNESALDHE